MSSRYYRKKKRRGKRKAGLKGCFLSFISIIILGQVLAGVLYQFSPKTSNSTKDSLLSQRFSKITNSYNDFSNKHSWPNLELSKYGTKEETLKPSPLYYVVLDGSGSMRKRKCAGSKTKKEVAISALKKFAEKIPSNARLGLLIFDQKGIKQRISPRKNNKAEFINEVQKLRPDGYTPLKTAIRKAAFNIEVAAAEQLGYGEYNLVIVTDGKASQGEDPTKIVKELISSTPIIIHTIGFCIDSNHSLNQPGYVFYRDANNPKELSTGLNSVLAESDTFSLTSFQ